LEDGDPDWIAQPRVQPALVPFHRTAAYRQLGPRLDVDRLSLEDLYTKALLHEQGFDTLPQVVSAAALDGYVRAGEIELFRGTLASHAEQLRSGVLFVSRGTNGGGIYAAGGPDGLSHATDYAQEPTSVIVRMVLKTGARVAYVEQLEQELVRLRAGIAPRAALTGLAPEAVMALSDRESRYAAYLGYDAVVDRRQGVWLILNRTALRIQHQDLRP
jgi:hypothetical protein